MNRPIRYRMYTPLLCALTLVAVTLRTVACFTARDAHGYFPASRLPDVAAWLLLAGCLLALTYPLFHRRIGVRPRVFHASAPIPLTALTAIAEVLFSVALLREALAGALTYAAGPRLLLTVTALIGLVGAGYYVLTLAFREDRDNGRVLVGFAAVLFCLLYATFLYFDPTVPLNATCKLTSQVTFIAFALYLLVELRVSLGRPAYGMQVALGFIAASLSAYAAIPSLITYAVTGEVIDHTVLEPLFALIFLGYVLTRLFVLSRLPVNTRSPIVAAIDEALFPTPAKELPAEATEEPTADSLPLAEDTLSADGAPHAVDDIPYEYDEYSEYREDTVPAQAAAQETEVEP